MSMVMRVMVVLLLAVQVSAFAPRAPFRRQCYSCADAAAICRAASTACSRAASTVCSCQVPRLQDRALAAEASISGSRVGLVHMNLVNPVRGMTNLVVVVFIAGFFLSRLDPISFFFDMLGGLMKLGWRLVVFSMVIRLFGKLFMGKLMKVGLGIMMAGGPIRAMKGAFFGLWASLFGALASFLAGRGPLDGLSRKLDGLADACEQRRPSGGMSDMMGGMGGDLSSIFDGPASGASPFGGDADLSSLFGSQTPFGAGAPSSQPFTPGSSTPGVRINVRSPSGSTSSTPPASPPKVVDVDSKETRDEDD